MNELNLAKSEYVFRNFDKIEWLFILTVITAMFLLIHFVRRFIPFISKKLPPRFRFYLLPLMPVLKLIIMFVSILIIIPDIIRPEWQNFLAIFGAAGVAFGFAFKDYASSLIAGIIALYEKLYRPGDRIMLNNTYGEVTAINLRAVKIITPDDTLVTIPHSNILSNAVFNSNDGNREQLCVAKFYLKPEHSIIKARQILTDVAFSSPFTKLNRPINVIINEGVGLTEYKIKAYPIDGRDEFKYITDLTVRAKKALMNEGFEFVSLPIKLDS